ncbi:type II secretion system protein J [Rhizobium sp. YIM 134829]|uniref:PulJ/GspJ family protein n=1 Tax=Rhizobium sp. YIM 134829 TaxID=3390453 RepID=UPI00397B6458
MRRRSTSGREGFILAEALVSMAISAFVLIALMSLVSMVTRASTRLSAANLEVETQTRTFATLSHDLEAIAPLRWAGPGAGFIFRGRPDSLIFARQPSSPAEPNEFVRLTSTGTALSEERGPLPPDATALPIAASATQVQKRYVARFAYFGRGDGATEVLLDRWERADEMPVAIRVSLFTANGSPAGALRIPIRITGEIGCAIGGTCGNQQDDADRPADTEQTADPEDTRGWLRYLSR